MKNVKMDFETEIKNGLDTYKLTMCSMRCHTINVVLPKSKAHRSYNSDDPRDFY